ncbi:hypothetical protein Hypma_012520 [Hypsizygus marmoreus]|uniref:Uncharacterized protein n=1 Tax=Hypsizygus marmoreus TaxID=39966 RepID=A0A369JE63_HYPMA|nr:hypothetical protein Hypma_012520 [Hypsizygus marmoreus]
MPPRRSLKAAAENHPMSADEVQDMDSGPPEGIAPTIPLAESIASKTEKPAKKAPKKRGRAGTTTAGSSEAPKKRGKVADTLPARDSLPERINRVINPGAPDKKATRRTSAQVTEAARIQKEFSNSLVALEEQKRVRLAEIELAQEAEEEEEARMAVSHVNDVSNMKDAMAKDPEDEDVPFFEVDDEETTVMADDHDNATVKPVKVQKSTRKKKPGRGDVQALVDAKKEEIRSKGAKTGDGPAHPKHLVGLLPDWKSKVNTPTVSRIANTPNVAFVSIASQLSDSEEPEQTPSSSRKAKSAITKLKVGKTPVKRETPTLACSLTLSSDLSFIEDGPEDVLPQFVRAQWATCVLPTLYRRLFCSDDPFTSFYKGDAFLQIVQEVLELVFPGTSYQVVRGSKLFDKASDRVGEKRGHFGSRAIKVVKAFFEQRQFSNNPEEIARYAKWAARKDGPGIWRLPSPQHIIDPKHPDYTVHHQPCLISPILTPVCFQLPVYIFESRFMVETIEPLLKSAKNSVGNFGNPQGCVALAATAVERAFRMFLTGEFIEPQGPRKLFSGDINSDAVKQYLKTIGKFSDRRWRCLLDAYGTNTEDSKGVDEVGLFDELLLENGREDLYIASSPIRDEEDS